MMYKYFSANSTSRYIDILDELVEQYDNTKHSSIGMTRRNQVKRKTKLNFREIYYGNYDPPDRKARKFSLGDKVRITRKNEPSRKGIHRDGLRKFLVSDVRYTDPTAYKIVDYNNEEIKGSFYQPELQKTTQEMFRIEKVIRRKCNKSVVKWLGYPDSFNFWIYDDELVKLQINLG